MTYIACCLGVGLVLFVTFYVWSLCRAAASDVTIDDGHAFGGDDIR